MVKKILNGIYPFNFSQIRDSKGMNKGIECD